MRQDTPLLHEVPAKVLGFLSRDFVYVVPYAGMRGDESNNGKWGFQSKIPIPRDLWPDDLLRLNAEVWLIYERSDIDDFGEVVDVCERNGFERPEKYRSALAAAREYRDREFNARRDAEAERRREEADRHRWWQFWR